MTGFLLLGSDSESTAGTIAGRIANCQALGMAGASVKLFQVSDDAIVATTTADENGDYSFTLPSTGGLYYVVAFNVEGTLAGVTLPTLVAV